MNTLKNATEKIANFNKNAKTVKVCKTLGDFYSFVELKLFLNFEEISFNFCLDRNFVSIVLGKNEISIQQEKEIEKLVLLFGNEETEIQYF